MNHLLARNPREAGPSRHETSILAVCGDPGGASALAPVVAALRARGYSVPALVYGAGRTVWAQQQLPFQDWDATNGLLDAASLLRRLRTKLLLAATSVNEFMVESQFVLAARDVGVPSLAVLDFWSNYAARYSDASGTLVAVPDRIAVMDERARDEMIAVGIESSRLVITGQPAFDALAGYERRTSNERKATIRSALGVQPRERMVLFASQPISSVLGTGPADPLYPGYTEHTVLGALVPALERIADRRGQAVTLLLRPHPREATSDLSHWRSERIRILLSADGDGREVALAADLVIGMSTVLLLEACLMGCPVVSLQPGLRLADPLITNRTGHSRPVYREAEIEEVLESLLFDDAARARALARLRDYKLRGDATQRVIQLVTSMVTPAGRLETVGKDV